jgi:hypothetical protein
MDHLSILDKFDVLQTFSVVCASKFDLPLFVEHPDPRLQRTVWQSVLWKHGDPCVPRAQVIDTISQVCTRDA